MRIRLVAADLDGVVYRGWAVLPEVPEALADVVRRGLDLRYVSNNSTAHRQTVSDRLAAMGVPAGADRILTSGFVTGRWLQQRLAPGSRVMVVGEAGLIRELCEAGFDAYHAGGGPPAGAAATGGASTSGALAGPASPAGPSVSAPAAIVSAPAATSSGASTSASAAIATLGGGADGVALPRVAPPAAVVVGMDRAISFQVLADAQAAIMAGAVFVATNPDTTFPTPNGLVPGAGAIVAAVATAAGAEPILMGKPSQALAETLAGITGIPSRETLFIGDRLETDIAMASAAGMVTALVLTGVTTAAELEKARADKAAGEMAATALPDYVLSDLGQLPALLDTV